jgi:hypothetical protein
VNKATRIISKCGYLSVAPNWGAGEGDNGGGMVRTKCILIMLSNIITNRIIVLIGRLRSSG